MEYQFKSLELCRQMDDKKAIAARLINIGTAYSDQSNFNQAIKYFTGALEIKTQLDDKPGISMCYNNMGEVYNLKGDFGKAIEYYEKSLNIDTELEDQEGMAIGLLNIGNVHAKQQNIEKATQYYNQSLAIAKLNGNKRLAANVLNLIGELLINQGKYTDANGHFNRPSTLVLKLATKVKLPNRSFCRA
jgi:tetratricopeptide (TPR) repeat protein